MVWCDGGNSMPINSEAPLEDQFVPTCESAASQFHARSMIQNHHHVLIEGKESSKILLLKTLLNSLDENMMLGTFLYQTAAIHANST